MIFQSLQIAGTLKPVLQLPPIACGMFRIVIVKVARGKVFRPNQAIQPFCDTVCRIPAMAISA